MHKALGRDGGVARRGSESAPRSETRIPEIDGLRGLAVLLVLVWHFVGAVIAPSLGPTAKIVAAILIFGRTGVDLFFVISGFLIIGILIDRRNCSNYFRVFYTRRALRILPPYAFLLVTFWTLSALLPKSYYFGWQIPWWSYLTFTQNWFMIKMNDWGPAASSVTWSVAIEEQFYLLFPFVVFFTPPKYLKSVLVWIGIISAMGRAGCHALFSYNAFLPYVATCLRLDGLCVGGLLAVALRDPTIWAKLEAFRPVVRKSNLFLLALVPVFLIGLYSSPRSTMYYWGHSYLTLLYSVSLTTILLSNGGIVARILRSRPLRELGTISYSLYLFHPMIIGLAFLSAGKKEQLTSAWDAILLGGSLLFTMGLCLASYRWIEWRLLAHGHRLKYTIEPPPNATPLGSESPEVSNMKASTSIVSKRATSARPLNCR